MKLFMVHVGFYDEEMGEGLYESHINFFLLQQAMPNLQRRRLLIWNNSKKKKCT